MVANKRILCVDGMLGRLARLLRIMGFNTIYVGGVRDKTILELASRTGCAIVTKDKDFYLRAISRGFSSILVKAEKLDESLAEVLNRLGVSRVGVNPKNARCPFCNTQVTVFNAEELAGQDLEEIPERVLHGKKEFYVCLVCGRVYWVGRHWLNIKNLEARVNALLDEDEQRRL